MAHEDNRGRRGRKAGPGAEGRRLELLLSERHREREGAEGDPCGMETITDQEREEQSLHCRRSSGND